MFAQWVANGEDWRKTQIFARISHSTGKVDSDARDWLTRVELEQKMGKQGADAMIAFLEAKQPEKCRDHPDAPGLKDSDFKSSCVSGV